MTTSWMALASAGIELKILTKRSNLEHIESFMNEININEKIFYKIKKFSLIKHQGLLKRKTSIKYICKLFL